MGRPTVEPHFGSVDNSKSFEEAYDFIKRNPEKIYHTGLEKEFTTEARITTKGNKKGQKVIVFMRLNKESARSYKCCWGSQTNCNRTYIDPYSHKI